jgi:hypothetical protein
MNIIRNTTEGIYPLQPFQQALWDQLSQGGFKQGQMTLYASVRQTGKSYLNALYGSTGIKSLYYSNLCKEIVLPMKPKPKYKFSRAKWYEATLPGDRQAVFAWCTEQFGPEPYHPDAWSRWYFNVNRTFRFRDAKDYEWFLLRWGK